MLFNNWKEKNRNTKILEIIWTTAFKEPQDVYRGFETEQAKISWIMHLTLFFEETVSESIRLWKGQAFNIIVFKWASNAVSKKTSSLFVRLVARISVFSGADNRSLWWLGD